MSFALTQANPAFIPHCSESKHGRNATVILQSPTVFYLIGRGKETNGLMTLK